MPARISPNLVSLLLFTASVAAMAVCCGLWAWSCPTFACHEIALGLIDILALVVTIAAISLAAWPANRRASPPFIPYLLWIGRAAAPNVSNQFTNAAAA